MSNSCIRVHSGPLNNNMVRNHIPNASMPVDAAEYTPNCSGPQLYFNSVYCPVNTDEPSNAMK